MAESRQPGGNLNPEIFFRACEASFAEAEARSAVTSRRNLRLADLDIDLHFAGHDTEPLVMPALRHLVTENPGDHPIRIGIWDPASGAQPIPPCPWGPDDHLSRGDIRGFDSREWKIAFGLGVNVLSLWSDPERRGLFHPFAPTEIPLVYFGSPLLHLIQWMAPAVGKQLVHAAAIGRGDDALLLVGRGGAGKSTTALACLHGGMDYLADDYCLVGARPEPRVHSVYSSGKIHLRHLDDLTEFEPLVANRKELDREKALLFLHSRFASRIRSSARLRGLILPRVTAQTGSTVEPAPRPLALQILAASSLFQLAGTGADSFHTIADLVRKLPVYFLNVGSDLGAIVPTVDALIDELRPSS